MISSWKNGLRTRSVRIAEHNVEHVTVLGYGRTGRAVASYLHEHGVRTFVSDSGILTDADRKLLSTRGDSYEQGGHTSRALQEADLIVLSPGVRPNTPILRNAKKHSILILSELDLAYLLSPDTPLIAVTGTNGKSTTVKLIEAILRQQGLGAVAAGNIGLPFITLVDDPPDVVVLEVSSFQLEQSSIFHSHIACLLNIAPDHLDRHGTMDRYIAAKASLFDRQAITDLAIIERTPLIPIRNLVAWKVFFEDIVLPQGAFVDSLAPHNRSNLRAAIACCNGILPKLDANHINFPSLEDAFHLPFRLQSERRIGQVNVINDSKSTNAASTISALESIDGPCVLILGGRHKGAGYNALAHTVLRHDVRHVILFGEGAPLLKSTLRDVGYTKMSVCSTLDRALKLALKEAQDGDTLLFSPACSSYDQYRNYVERGEHFSRLAKSSCGQ